MATIETAVRTLHLLFAGLWAGDLRPAPLAAMLGRLTTLSRVSALVLLLTGGHLAAAGYTAATLLGSTRGYLVLAMVALWLALAAMVEVGASRLGDGLAADKIREPAAANTTLFRAASLVAVLLLLVGGVLSV